MNTITLEALERILSAETSVVDPDDVYDLMRVIRKESVGPLEATATKDEEIKYLEALVESLPPNTYLRRWLGDSLFSFANDTKADHFCEMSWAKWKAIAEDKERVVADLLERIEQLQAHESEKLAELRRLNFRVDEANKKAKEMVDQLRSVMV